MDEEAKTIEVLAEVITASHRTTALAVVANRIKEYEERGDAAGVRVWQKVAEKIAAQSPTIK